MNVFLAFASLSILALHNSRVEGNAVISSLVSKLGLDQQYQTEPCRLMPFVELSPLLAMEGVKGVDLATVKRAQKVYYEIGLSGMLYAGCLMTREMGETKATAVLQQWVSGYGNNMRKLVVSQDFQKAISDGKASTSDKECLTKSIDRLKNSQVSKNPDGLVTSELIQQNITIKGKEFTPEELKAATEMVAVQCLTTTPGLSDGDKADVIAVLMKAAKFFHHIEGGVLRTIVGDKKQGDVLTVLLRGILKANYLQLHEKMERLQLLLDGDAVSSKKCSNKGVEECIGLIESFN